MQKPGTNFSMTTGTRSTFLSSSTTSSTVSSEVFSPLTTSTSGMICGGANQWAMTVFGRRRSGIDLVDVEIRRVAREDGVVRARPVELIEHDALGLQILGDALDDEAGVGAGLRDRLRGGDARQRGRTSSALRRPCPANVCILAAATDIAFSSVASEREYSETGCPAQANTWARPGPIVPAPTTATFLTSLTSTSAAPRVRRRPVHWRSAGSSPRRRPAPGPKGDPPAHA